MTPLEFIKTWKTVDLSERATAHSHFNDLCRLIGHEEPIRADPHGEWFTFEKGLTKTGGGEGFADVWKRNHFAWEYKRRKRNLDDALLQLTRYAAALEHPPIRVACDTNRFLIETAWTNAVPQRYELFLEELVDPAKLDIIRSVFFDPEKLRPKTTRAALTREAADKFSTIAERLQGRGSREDVAHFINQLVFCFFANSVKLLPEGLFLKLLKRAGERPAKARDYFGRLFGAMESGGEFDLTEITWFNGGLFDGRGALPLDEGDIGLLQAAASLDWSQIDPTIFGTLFERFLDPEKRKQIGAHYTDAEKIRMLVDPVILRPLRDEWELAKLEIEALLSGAAKAPMRAKERRRMSPLEAAEEVRSRFLERLRTLSILDPACGSGNFLYLALQGVKDIENRANLEAEALGLSPRALTVGPEILHGIEINEIAAELARTTIWIGDIQWRRRNGIYYEPPPILRKLDAIQRRDALLTIKPDGSVEEANWPKAEFIVGNPPFLGGKLMRAALGDHTVELLFQVFDGRVPHEADLVTYWFEKAHAEITSGRARRAGLVATNSIRGGANRRVLDRILHQDQIFEAWSDEAWVINGAAVRVSLVCFGRGLDQVHLNGKPASQINADLTSGILDLTKVKRLDENLGVAFMGDTKGGSFDVPGELARSWLKLPANPNGRPNSDVLRPWRNGQDIVRRPSDKWIIDFGFKATEKESSLYEAPFEYIKEHVFPERSKNRRQAYRLRWWRHVEPRPALTEKLEKLDRYIVTPTVAKYRIFVFLDGAILPDHQLIAIARADYTTFGILHSRYHENWSLGLGSSLEDRPRYTPTTTFESFPFPEGLTPNVPASDYAVDPRAAAIAAAAENLHRLRNAWLNPLDLTLVEPEVVTGYPHRVLPRNTVAAAKLRERTLTKLYNERPQWLVDAHKHLDAAVAAAYGWSTGISDEYALRELISLNLSRGGTPNVPEGKPYTVDTEAFDKISEVEGVHLSESMRRTFSELDAEGGSEKHRRKRLAQRLKQIAP
ncbi:class I SAM-dependent DNA methyltransferase [Bradyrhizobium diazoefficiens]|nr:class I SAM-dependent DNA methyltransferase [Bradyrhizobium diazoefficiens]QQN63529.1 class I SAM-dependent DNA methyltransferase [Bradyrhizobium diazoefficiens]